MSWLYRSISVFIRSITTTAILLASAAAHAHAVAPMTDSSLRNDTVDTGMRFRSAEPRPNAQQSPASFPFAALEKSTHNGLEFSHNPEVLPQFSALQPLLFVNPEADPFKEGFHASPLTDLEHPAVTRYYNAAPDIPPHVAPPIFDPQMRSCADPDLHRDRPFVAITYEELTPRADPFSPGYAASLSWATPLPEDRFDWSCIAINGRECPPSLHQAAFASGPRRA